MLQHYNKLPYRCTSAAQQVTYFSFKSVIFCKHSDQNFVGIYFLHVSYMPGPLQQHFLEGTNYETHH
jgi:hypothetical protein